MASYGSNIIQLPAQSPFDIMQNPLVNMYAKAALKSKFDARETAQKEKKQAANYDKYKAFAKSQGKTIEEGYTDKGPYFKTVEDKPVSMSDLNVGAAGALPPNKYAQIGKNMGVAPVTLPAEQNPEAAMSLINGGVGNVQEQPVGSVAQDYGQTVMNALKSKGYGVKAGKQAQLPTDFANDFKVAHDGAAGDADVFVSNLKDLGMKYADNPTALAQVQRLITMNKQTKKSGRPSRK